MAPAQGLTESFATLPNHDSDPLRRGLPTWKAAFYGFPLRLLRHTRRDFNGVPIYRNRYPCATASRFTLGSLSNTRQDPLARIKRSLLFQNAGSEALVQGLTHARQLNSANKNTVNPYYPPGLSP